MLINIKRGLGVGGVVESVFPVGDG
jgi:hypothetical protein